MYCWKYLRKFISELKRRLLFDMIFQLYPLFIVLEKPGYIALWVPSVQHPDVFWAYWGGGGGGPFFFFFQFNYIFVLKHCIICQFLIHSDRVQKMLTTLFKLAWNTQKNTWRIFLRTKARCFLILKRFWWRLMKSSLNAVPYWFFLHIFLLIIFCSALCTWLFLL